MSKKIIQILAWGSAIVLVGAIILFIVIIKGLAGIGEGKRKHREDWMTNKVAEFKKEMEECYGLKEGDYRIVDRHLSYGNRTAEFTFEVGGKEYLACVERGMSGFASNYFLASDSPELKALAEERIKASGVLFTDDYNIVSARLECSYTEYIDGKPVTMQVLPMRLSGEEYEKFLRGEEYDPQIWRKVTFVVEVECGYAGLDRLPSVTAGAYKQDLKPISELRIRYYHGYLTDKSPETLDRERVITYSEEKSESKDTFPEKS